MPDTLQKVCNSYDKVILKTKSSNKGIFVNNFTLFESEQHNLLGSMN